MDGTYFVGRSDLLGWINSTLSLKLSKIEQTATGAVACQLLDALHPGSVNLSKVDFNAKNEYDFINNYKVLQAAFTKLNINKSMDVNKLIKARPLDNMEFMQWFKAYFDSQTGGHPIDYDAITRRATCKTGDIKGLGAPRKASGSTTPRGHGPVAIKKPIGPSVAKENQGAKTANITASAASDTLKAKKIAPDPAISSKIDELTDQVADLKLKADTTERERDFYFDKLRDIEILCQTPELQAVPAIKFIERILYAADEDVAKQALAEAQEAYRLM
eukprot:jgi/Botrbrau1/21680/Bobra.43_1s0077.1